jgi:thiamine biosynthesis protein ThiI
MKVECAYFHSYPYTSQEAEDKVHALAKIIADYGVDTHLNVIPFTDVQMKIKAAAPKEYTTLMLRICMMKAANMLASRVNANCIITGESLGQVASQTAENLAVTESFAEHPVYRPLIGLDKEEITATAVEIGSFETSILPYEDCCVLFTPRHPVLKAKREDAEDIYRRLEVDALIQKAFDERKIFRYSLRDTLGSRFATRPFVPQDGECRGRLHGE